MANWYSNKKSAQKKDDDFKYEILEECGTISERNNGYELKLRLIKWGDNDPKYDIRLWKTTEEGGEKQFKVNTFTGDEMQNLLKILKKIDEQPANKQPRVAGAKRSRK